jgi:hypothetical protein
MDWQPWLKLLHVAAGFTFALAHGVSAFATLKLRGERDPARVIALLDVSKFSLPISDLAILVLLASGIASGFVGGYWGHLWIWVSIGVLVFLFIFMSLRGVRHHDEIRHALGTAGFYDKKDAPIPEADPEALARALDSPRALELAAVGGIGLLVLLWLMVLKPF